MDKTSEVDYELRESLLYQADESLFIWGWGRDSLLPQAECSFHEQLTISNFFFELCWKRFTSTCYATQSTSTCSVTGLPPHPQRQEGLKEFTSPQPFQPKLPSVPTMPVTFPQTWSSWHCPSLNEQYGTLIASVQYIIRQPEIAFTFMANADNLFEQSITGLLSQVILHPILLKKQVLMVGAGPDLH